MFNCLHSGQSRTFVRSVVLCLGIVLSVHQQSAHANPPTGKGFELDTFDFDLLDATGQDRTPEVVIDFDTTRTGCGDSRESAERSARGVLDDRADDFCARHGYSSGIPITQCQATISLDCLSEGYSHAVRCWTSSVLCVRWLFAN